jgi:predicted Zn-dependent peptidase
MIKHSVSEVELKNGGRGLLVDVPSATVLMMEVSFRAGFDYAANQDVFEVPHVMEHLMLTANEEYPDKIEFEKIFTKNGAWRNAYTNDVAVAYMMICPDFEWERIFELQSLSICKPKFTQQNLDSEMGNVRTELTGYQNNYGWLLNTAIDVRLGDTTKTLEGEVESLEHIDLEAVRQHYERTHTGDNMRFIILGDLADKREKILRDMNSWDLGRGELFSVMDNQERVRDKVLVRREDAKSMTFGIFRRVLRRMSLEELASMYILDHILNGTFASRMWGQARNRGIVYGMGSGAWRGIYNSAWRIGGEVNYENAEELFELIQTELDKVLAGDITEEEIQAAKEYKLGTMQMREYVPSSMGGLYAGNYYATGEIFDPSEEKERERILGVTKESMMALAKEFLESDIMIMGVLGNIDDEFVDKLWAKIK